MEIMEGLPVVCYSTGTMNSVLHKLTKLKNHSNRTDDFSVLIESFKEDLRSLKEDFCDKISGQRGTHKEAKVCMKQVRELVFNIEDWIDQELEKNLVVDPSVRQTFEYFKAKIHGARERFTRYFILRKIVPTETDAAPIKITINPRLLVEEKSCHGLLDGPRDELVKYLTDEKEEMRKVVSIVGREGLGKTTLAKEIYSELQLRGLFECQAFVSVGRRPVMREILNDILHQVNPNSTLFRSQVVNVQEIITELQEYLGRKRYFILVDGIWSIWAWKVINCVLPNNRGSRVLTTTCIINVGKSCSSYPNDLVYQMEALSENYSRFLFLDRIISLQEEGKGGGYAEVFGYMLNMCGGIPLAITVAGGLLLARESRKLAELNMLGESIYSSLEQYSFSEGMTKILHMTYADLSLPLRSCFLYLCVFPDNHMIKKDRLILLWGAEGFIPRIDEECLWVTGGTYFNELISRRLIKPVFSFDDVQAVGCTVHTVILDFITSMSREENFATSATELNSSPFPCDTIRRHSLDCRNNDEAVPLSTSIAQLSRMRSLTVFGDVEGKLNLPHSTFVSEDDEEMDVAPPPIVSRDSGGMLDDPSVSGDDEGMFDDPLSSEDDDPLIPRASLNFLSAFKLLRVLDLEDTNNLKYDHLQGIGGLVLLRYLGLGGTGINRLPEDIGELEQLETLDLRRNGRVPYLPASIVKLQKLTHLLLDEVVAMEIWEMPELEGASGILVKGSRSLRTVVELLRKSKQLSMLGLILRLELIHAEPGLVSFIDEVVKSKLQSLSLDCGYDGDEGISLIMDLWERVNAPLGKKFEAPKFELKIHCSKGVPPNMGSFASLTHLHIILDEAKVEDFLVLGSLTNLVLLNLHVIECAVRGRFIIRAGIFPCLKVFSFGTQFNWMGLEFVKGAMPQLRRLGLLFRASQREAQEYPDIGIENLTCLTRVHATINCSGATASEVEATEAAIRGKLSKIATKPTFELNRENEGWTTGTNIQPLENDDQIREDEGQYSSPVRSRRVVSKKADKSALESSIEHLKGDRQPRGKTFWHILSDLMK